MTPTEPVLEPVPCALGCEEGDDLVLRAGDMLHGLPGEFTVLRCRACELMRTSPRPNSRTIASYYPHSYGPHRENTTQAKPPEHGAITRIKKLLRPLTDTRARSIPDLPVGSLLEFGCGTGEFLEEMASRGWDVVGLDLSPKAVDRARARGLEVHLMPPESFDPGSRRFDLITGWMALEHVADPVAALRHLRTLTTREGRLAISTPRCDSLEFRVFGADWYALQLPTHFWHFTAQTIDAVLARSGWRIDRIIDQPTLTNAVISTGWRLQSRGRLPRIAARLSKYAEQPGKLRIGLAPLAFLASRFGQTGRMTVWATADV